MVNVKTVLLAFGLVGVLSIAVTGCGESACDQVTQKFAECSGSGDVTDGESADCSDAEEACAQCYLDSKKDICSEILAINAECSDKCSVGI